MFVLCLDSCYTVGSYEVSPKNILDLASDRGFEDINCEGSLLDPSLMESSLLESSQDHSNVSIRRKRKNFLGTSTIVGKANVMKILRRK